MKNAYWHNKARVKQMLDYVVELVPPVGKVEHSRGKNRALEEFRAAANRYYNLHKKGVYEDSHINHARKIIGLWARHNRIKINTGLSPELLLLVDTLFGEIVVQAYYEQQGGLVPSMGGCYEA